MTATDKLTWAEVKRRWEHMTDEQREAVHAKQQWEQCSRMAVAHDWPSMFPAPSASDGEPQ